MTVEKIAVLNRALTSSQRFMSNSDASLLAHEISIDLPNIWQATRSNTVTIDSNRVHLSRFY